MVQSNSEVHQIALHLRDSIGPMLCSTPGYNSRMTLLRLVFTRRRMMEYPDIIEKYI